MGPSGLNLFSITNPLFSCISHSCSNLLSFLLSLVLFPLLFEVSEFFDEFKSSNILEKILDVFFVIGLKLSILVHGGFKLRFVLVGERLSFLLEEHSLVRNFLLVLFLGLVHLVLVIFKSFFVLLLPELVVFSNQVLEVKTVELGRGLLDHLVSFLLDCGIDSLEFLNSFFLLLFGILFWGLFGLLDFGFFNLSFFLGNGFLLSF